MLFVNFSEKERSKSRQIKFGDDPYMNNFFVSITKRGSKFLRIPFFNTYEPATSFYRDLLPFLAEQNSTVEIIVSNAEYRSGRGRLEDAVKHSKIRVTRIPAGYDIVCNKFQKLWVMITYMTGAAVSSLFGSKVELNFFLTQPPLFSIWGYFLKVFRGQRYCCLMMDIYPDLAVQDGMLKKTAFTTRFLGAVSRFTLRHADIVIVIGRCMRDYLVAKGIPAQRIHLITNWTDENKVVPVPHSNNPLRKELNLGNDYVILYSGNMGISHFFDDIIEVARRLREIDDLRFIFFGNGVRRKEIELAKKKYILGNLLLLPFQPVERLSESLSIGDVHFISLRDGFEGLVVPSKAYSAMAVGRPIIYQGNKSGEIARMVAESNIGSVVPLRNADALEREILKSYRNPSMVAKHGSKALALSRGRFGRQQALDKYKRVLIDELCSTHRCGKSKKYNGYDATSKK